MKKKFGKILILIAVLILALAAFTACGETPDGGDDGYDDHVHTYSTEWKHDLRSHWHEATCGHDVRGDEASHSFVNGECECGYKADMENWQRDEKTHWHNAEDNGVALRIDEAAHELINNECECGIKIEFKTRINVDTFRITGITGDELPVGAHLTIPEKISGCPVVGIADAAFVNQTNLASISIPETVTSIGSFAFDGCSSLSEIEFNGTVNSLGEQAFADCIGLKSMVLADGITSIGRNTFLNCSSLESVTIPESVTKIYAQAFARCTSLKEIQLPSKLEFIGMSAFQGSGLTEITLPDTVTALGTYAFRDCTSLKSAKISKNVKYAIDNWFGGCSALETLTIPFVGSHKQPYRNDFDSDADYNDWMKDIVARDVCFGYIFGTDKRDVGTFNAVEQGEHVFYIPKSLTSVTVLGGTVEEDSFINCDGITVTLASGVIDHRTDA